MNFKEETERLVNELEKLGLSRGAIELELAYSPNYIGQMISRGSNVKIVAALKMLLRVKTLEMKLAELEGQKEPDETEMQKIVKLLTAIGANLNDTAHNTALNQALLKAGLSHQAKLEAMVTRRNHWTKKDQQKILEELNEDAARIFFRTYETVNQSIEVLA